MIAAIPAPKFITKRAGKLLGVGKSKPKTANKKTGSKKSQEGTGSDKNTEKKAESKEANSSKLSPHERGELGVKASEREARERGEKILGKEVSIKLKNGKRTKADILVETQDKKLKCIECKNGPKARLTTNQKTASKELPREGGEFRGERAREAGFEPGTRVDKIEFQIDKHNIEK